MHPFKQRWGFLPCKALPTSVGSFWGWVAPFCPNVTYMRLLENSNHAAIFQPLACILILSKCASVFKMFLIEVRNNSACFRFNIFESSVQAGKIPRHNFFFFRQRRCCCKLRGRHVTFSVSLCIRPSVLTSLRRYMERRLGVTESLRLQWAATINLRARLCANKEPAGKRYDLRWSAVASKSPLLRASRASALYNLRLCLSCFRCFSPSWSNSKMNLKVLPSCFGPRTDLKPPPPWVWPSCTAVEPLSVTAP